MFANIFRNRKEFIAGWQENTALFIFKETGGGNVTRFLFGVYIIAPYYILEKKKADMRTIDGIPVYEIRELDPQTGMEVVSLVDFPAVESDFIYMRGQEPKPLHLVTDEEKHIVTGVVCRADFPVYRNDEAGEYYLVFTKERIRQMAEKYLTESRADNVNLMHRPDTMQEGIHMVQWYIKDKGRGIDPSGFENIEDGSLFAEYHVTDGDIWQRIKAGEFRGFSLEGYFHFSRNKQINNTMSKLDKIKYMLARLVSMASVTTDKGIIAWDTEDELKEGDNVYTVNEAGESMPAEDGDYTTEDGKTITVEGGKAVKISEAGEEVEPQPQPQENAEEEPKPESTPEDIEGLRKEVNELYKLVDSILKRLDISRDEAEQMRKAFAELTEQVKDVKEAPAARSAAEEYRTEAQDGGSQRYRHAIEIAGAKRI